MKKLLIVLVLSLAVACAKAPPTLTPEALTAYRATQVVKALDVFRDTAIAANFQAGLSVETTRKIVLYHESIVKVIQASPTGWKPTALSGLDEVVKTLTPKDRTLLAPYVTLVKTVITEVTQ